SDGRSCPPPLACPANAMRRLPMRLIPSLFLAILGIAVCGQTASATHCGACRFPRGMTSNHQLCMPIVRHKVCYQTVCEDRVCVKCRPVYQTTMKECRYTT